MQEFLRFFGHGFCHQAPLRSFEVDGLIFSVCARDTGIYLGFFFAIIAAFIMYAPRKQKPGELPPWPYLVALAFFITPMAFDGLTSYLGLRPTTNTIRYITGLFTGCAAGSIVTPLLFSLSRNAATQERFLSRPREFVLHLVVIFALGTIFLFVYPYLKLVAPLLVLVAFLSIVFSVNLILLTLSKRFAPRHNARHWLLLIALALALSLVEITVFGAIRTLAEQLLLSGHSLSEIMNY